MGSVGVSVNSSQEPPLKAQPPDRCRGYHAERNINFQLHLPPPSPQTKKHKQILFLWPAHTNPFLCLDFSSSSQFAASTKKHPIVSENMKRKFKATSLCFAVVHVWIPARHCAVIEVRRQSLKLAGGGRCSFPLRVILHRRAPCLFLLVWIAKLLILTVLQPVESGYSPICKSHRSRPSKIN